MVVTSGTVKNLHGLLRVESWDPIDVPNKGVATVQKQVYSGRVTPDGIGERNFKDERDSIIRGGKGKNKRRYQE